MGLVILIIQIVISIILPAWLYLWFSKQIKKQFPSHSGLRWSIPDIHFLLKRWWAEWCINAKKETWKANVNNYDRNVQNIPRRIIEDEDSCNSLLFYATDQKGNSIFIKFAQRRRRMAEVSLQLTTSDARHYVLPDYPDTIVKSSLYQEWSAVGLRIESLEFQQRWRVTYNGMLRDLSKGDDTSDDNIEHVRLNFIFVASSQPLKWPGDWSTKLHAEALAREPWKNPQWINKIKLMNYLGFDQWGSMIGQVTYENSSVSTLYLRGLSQRRWGKHESHQFHETVSLIGVMSNGSMCYLGAGSTKHSFSQMRFGQFRTSNEKKKTIEWLGLKLSDFTEDNCKIYSQHKVWFTAGGVDYGLQAVLGHPINLHCGKPWNWINQIIPIKVEINDKPGFGLLQISHPYTGPYHEKTSAKLQLLRPPSMIIQKDDYIIFFNDGKCQNENIVGGKGFSLGMLTSIKTAEFIVPEGFCVTVFALDLQLQTHKELQQAIDHIEDVSVGKKVGDLKKCCEDAVRIIESTPVVEAVRDAISEAIKEVESKNEASNYKYAIRSSAVGEDSEETSAAGQNSSFLSVRGLDNIIDSVAKCWASLFSYQSVEYRKLHGLRVKSSMGVCVQRMVDAEAAGVMFTRHPTTGNPSNIVITANFGLGETVVSAMVEPDTITVHRSWKNELNVKTVETGDKLEKIILQGGEVTTKKLDEKETRKVCVSENIALRLATIGMNIETLFGSARDIEWAVAGDKIFLLQARPITTLNSWTDFELTHELDAGVPSDIDITMFANVGEVFPNPVSPLSISTIIKSLNDSVARKNDPENLDRNYISVIATRCVINYYNTMMRDVGKDVSIMNKVIDIAVCGNVVLTPESHKIALERNGPVSLLRGILAIYDMMKETWRNSAVEKEAKNWYENIALNADDFHTAYSLNYEINKKFEIIDKIICCHSFTSRVSVFYQAFAMVLLTKGYQDFITEHFSDIAILLSSCTDVVSSEVPIKLKKIASLIKADGKDEEFRKINPTDANVWLKSNCPAAAKELKLLLEEHGHRCIQEMDLFAEPWCFKPENLITTIQAVTTSCRGENANEKLSVERTVASLKTPTSGLIKWLLKKIVPLCRKAVTHREMTKAILVNAIHKFRLAYRKLGTLMVAEGYLTSEDLIFFLTQHEIRQMLNNRNPTLIQKAYRRRRLLSQLKDHQYPEFNTGMPVPLKTGIDISNRDGSAKLRGTSVCGGSVLGRACVITDLSDATNIQHGDILITHSTDIGWSPYFPLLGGIVTELGGLISHGAVVAREYGVPCIVGAKGATKTFETGDTVLLVADVGLLQMVKKA